MNNAKPNQFFKDFFIINFSMLLERIAYYGFLSILVIYLTDFLVLKSTDPFTIYGWLVMCIALAAVVGALLGDLLKANKIIIIIGGLLQALAVISMALFENSLLYLTLGLFALGSGFVRPNIMAQFGKNALQKEQFIDSSFTFYFLFLYIAGTMGSFFLLWIGDNFNFKICFFIAALLFILASIIMIFSEKDYAPSRKNPTQTSSGWSIFFVISAALLTIVFWSLYEIYLDVTSEVKYSGSINNSLLTAIQSGSTIIAGFVLGAFWLIVKFRRYWKILTGLLLFGIGVLFLINTDLSLGLSIQSHHLVSVFLLGFAEVLIIPIIYALITKHSNTKYLALIIACIIVISFFVVKGVRYLAKFYTEWPVNSSYIMIGVILSLLAAGVGFSAVIMHRQNSKPPSHLSSN